MSVNPVAAAASPGIPQANGNVLDVLMLQAHVVCAALWLLSCVLVSLIAVPQLRRLPAPGFLHELQVRRDLVLGVLWATYALTLASGTYLVFHEAIYDPPFSGSDFDHLRDEAYGLPYYYALYAKIALFLLMGAASFVLAREAHRAAARSEAAGGPREDDEDWSHDPPSGGESAPVEIATRVAIRASRPRTSVATLWLAVGTLAVGMAGVGFCVTLIKYFHELSKAAVVYEQLRSR